MARKFSRGQRRKHAIANRLKLAAELAIEEQAITKAHAIARACTGHRAKGSRTFAIQRGATAIRQATERRAQNHERALYGKTVTETITERMLFRTKGKTG